MDYQAGQACAEPQSPSACALLIIMAMETSYNQLRDHFRGRSTFALKNLLWILAVVVASTDRRAPYHVYAQDPNNNTLSDGLSEYSVRLVNDSRIQIYYDGQWNAVCYPGVNDTVFAELACGQLGFPSGTGIGYSRTTTNGPIVTINCDGDYQPEALSECTFSNKYGMCNETSEDVKIYCRSWTCTYSIREKDTLWDISQLYSTTLENLQAMNPGINPDGLQIGQVVKVPCSDSSPSPSPVQNLTPSPSPSPSSSAVGTCAYSIKGGDTLWVISQVYGTTLENLQAINPGINPNYLQIGQIIKIPCSPGTNPSTSSQAAVQNPIPTPSPGPSPGDTALLGSRVPAADPPADALHLSPSSSTTPPDEPNTGGRSDMLTIVSAVVGSVTGVISAVAAVFGLMRAFNKRRQAEKQQGPLRPSVSKLDRLRRSLSNTMTWSQTSSRAASHNSTEPDNVSFVDDKGNVFGGADSGKFTTATIAGDDKNSEVKIQVGNPPADALHSSPSSSNTPPDEAKKKSGRPDMLTIVSAVVGSFTGVISAVAAVFGLMRASNNKRRRLGKQQGPIRPSVSNLRQNFSNTMMWSQTSVASHNSTEPNNVSFVDDDGKGSVLGGADSSKLTTAVTAAADDDKNSWWTHATSVELV
ncbi:hypothetical protein Vafri_18302 [Volvox africanus]|uniref:LysM domain-containing protein n=1 Tax=Volvox africanus TaxID=51714 RepID=A0A8J4F8A4_9CHLO|nr:hypothetical protein Vafri_18302 [Volvox africanus]